MPPLTAELSRSGGAASSNHSRRAQQVPEERLELDAGEVGTHAEVGAGTECEMVVRLPVHPELERVLEHLLVAVRRREEERDLVAGGDRHAPDLAVLGGRADEVDDRAHPTEDLLHRGRQELGLAAQALPLVGVFGEGEEAAADRVAGRLVARLDDELAVVEQLLLGERVPVDLRLR